MYNYNALIKKKKNIKNRFLLLLGPQQNDEKLEYSFKC